MVLLYQERQYHIVVGSCFNPSWSHEKTYYSLFYSAFWIWIFFLCVKEQKRDLP